MKIQLHPESHPKRFNARGIARVRRGFRTGLGAKLVSLIATLLVASTATLVWLSNRLYVDDNTALIQQMNSDTAANLAGQVREIFGNTADRIRTLGAMHFQSGGGTSLSKEIFAANPDFVAFFLYEKRADKPVLRHSLFSPTFSASGDLAHKLESQCLVSITAGFSGTSQVCGFQSSGAESAIAVLVPLVRKGKSDSDFTHVGVGTIRQDRFMRAFAENDIVTSFLVDRGGKYLVHPDPAVSAQRAKASNSGIVALMLEGRFTNGQTTYVDPASEERHLGAFHQVGFGGLGVISAVPEAKAFEAANRVQLRAFLAALVILSIAFALGYFYSDSITWPLRLLVEATRRISKGDFEIEIQPKTRDEVGELSLAFNEMARGLQERERVKATFNKFHSKEIADKLLSGEVRLGGERRDVVIFFSDIRGFTSMAESMKPEQVVEMLNEYMTHMVSVIRKHGGVVDKYVGDAIMAIWGVPIDDPESCFHAVSACLEMRQELAALNEVRLSRGLPALHIGMGLNFGPVVAGNIGSDEKMEYTVIGDTVNLASRVESLTKKFGSDLLISKSVRERVADRFVFEACDTTKVKGKSAAVEVFKVLGQLVDGKPSMIMTPYCEYDSEELEKKKAA